MKVDIKVMKCIHCKLTRGAAIIYSTTCVKPKVPQIQELYIEVKTRVNKYFI